MSSQHGVLAGQSAKQTNPTTIDALTYDLLLEIFLRLPSLAALIRAALTCRAWRHAVATSPSFRRRFRELHHLPLLGLYADPKLCSLPIFSPAYCWDRDMLAAIRRGDFGLTSLLDLDDLAANVPLRWRFCDCRDGYLLLANFHAKLLATINPLSGYYPDYIHMPLVTGATQGDIIWPHEIHLICSDEDPLSFQIVCFFHDESRVRAAVLSSKDWCKWRLLPWVEVAERALPHDAGKDWLRNGTQANGFLYWIFQKREHVLMLDTMAMEFSVLQLPLHLFGLQRYRFMVTGTTDGVPCIVYCTGLMVGVLIHRGTDIWIPMERTLQLKEDGILFENNDAVTGMAFADGFVYLATSNLVLVLCLETMELKAMLPRSFSPNYFRPYIMAWPPSLVGNYGCFAKIHDTVQA